MTKPMGFTDTWMGCRWKKINTGSPQPRPSVGFVLVTAPSGLFLTGGILKGESFNEMWKWQGETMKRNPMRSS